MDNALVTPEHCFGWTMLQEQQSIAIAGQCFGNVRALLGPDKNIISLNESIFHKNLSSQRYKHIV
jgi:hypothetical protein